MAATGVTSVLLSALKRGDDAEYPEEYVAAAAGMLAEEVAAHPKRARSLAFNLARNKRMRRALLSGAVTPRALCAADLSEWASNAVKRSRAAAAQRSDARLRVGAAGRAEYSLTRSVRCPECGGREARFTHMGTDMRDWHGRKNEVWGTKHDDADDDERACEIECTKCGHSWNGPTPEVAVEEAPSAGSCGRGAWQEGRMQV